MANKNRCTGVVEQLGTCRIEGGISSYNTSDVHTIGYDLLNCVQDVSQKIDKDRMSLTPIYLGATAGMRLLNLTNPKGVDIIFTLIQNVFKLKTGFKVNTIDIISGQNEGLFSWVTNNYLANKLIIEHFDQLIANSTIGTLDMGGASAQIAYRTGSKSNDSMSDDEVNVRLYGINHTVRASSNLCFGADQAILRYQKYLIMTRNPSRDEIYSPCLAIGRTQVMSGHKFKDQICMKLKDETKDINFDLNYTFSGKSDANECSRLIKEVILNKTKCEQTFELCFDVADTRPPESTQFYAISNYYYSARILNLSQPVNAEEYKQKTTAFCNADNSTIFKEWPLVLAKYVDVYCFQLNFVYTTISNIYRFEDRMWPNILFSAKIRDTDLGWSLGFMINSTNAIAAEKPTPPVVELFPFILVITLCTIILFFSIYFALKWIRSKDTTNKSESYEPISITS